MKIEELTGRTNLCPAQINVGLLMFSLNSTARDRESKRTEHVSGSDANSRHLRSIRQGAPVRNLLRDCAVLIALLQTSSNAILPEMYFSKPVLAVASRTESDTAEILDASIDTLWGKPCVLAGMIIVGSPSSWTGSDS